MLKTEKAKYFMAWSLVLITTLYLAFIRFESGIAYLILFLLCVIAGVFFDFKVCKWQYFFDNYELPENKNNFIHNSISVVEYKYEHYDKGWRNAWNYGLLVAHGIIVFIILNFFSYSISKIMIPWNNIIAISGLCIPYLFHQAYYYAIRIPVFQKNIYLHDPEKEEVAVCISQIILEKPQKNNEGWLLDRLVLFEDKIELVKQEEKPENGIDVKITTNRRDCIIPCVKEIWSYKELWDLIFYQNNQTADLESYYKTEWPGLKLYSGNDMLVKTCWKITVEKGAAAERLPVETKEIQNFFEREFDRKAVKVNCFFTIKRVI